MKEVDKIAQETGNHHCKETTLEGVVGNTASDGRSNREERT
jgi:hypothetical protein